MNYRIQELINQSWQNIEGAPRLGMEDMRRALMEELNPVMRELARLLIKEVMIEVVDEVQYQSGWATAELVVERVNDTFGIEK